MDHTGRKLAYCDMPSPVGPLYLNASDKGLLSVSFKENHALSATAQKDHPILRQAKQQLDEYFDGQRQQFDVPLQFLGTDFQKLVWQTLTTIPYGRTESYGQIAQQINRPKAARAVGMANNKNPIVIIVPCHRVIGASGQLVGYGGGLGVKEWLLKHERSLNNQPNH